MGYVYTLVSFKLYWHPHNDFILCSTYLEAWRNNVMILPHKWEKNLQTNKIKKKKPQPHKAVLLGSKYFNIKYK